MTPDLSPKIHKDLPKEAALYCVLDQLGTVIREKATFKEAYDSVKSGLARNPGFKYRIVKAIATYSLK